ncbi:MAG: hypothetical protein IJT58_06810 [Synergistaceae bacterium]|nr:hypothetical protein [Synergistaceae bacterium]
MNVKKCILSLLVVLLSFSQALAGELHQAAGIQEGEIQANQRKGIKK